MPAPKNSFKATLENNQLQLGCWLGMANAYAAEMSATAGFDWLLIDGEHAPNDISRISDQIGVLQHSGSDVVVRVPIGETWVMKQVLDAGAQTILVPMVESAAQARQLASSLRYPPEGVRGVGSALARASGFGSLGDYLTSANSEVCLLVQIESTAGLSALDEILSVDGVDGVFFGPADLAADMGHLHDLDAAEVKQAVHDGIKQATARNKPSGVLTLDLDFASRCAEQGASFIAVGIDVLLFSSGMRTLASRAFNVLGRGPDE